jgi:hypothetical protein
MGQDHQDRRAKKVLSGQVSLTGHLQHTERKREDMTGSKDRTAQQCSENIFMKIKDFLENVWKEKNCVEKPTFFAKISHFHKSKNCNKF